MLEINAGTGEDALFLVRSGHTVHATDISEAMVETIRAKSLVNGVGSRVKAERVDIQDLNSIRGAQYDGIVSNFGGLNCINEWDEFAKNAYDLLRPGGVLIVCLMGRTVPWEWFWFGVRGHFRKAFRRIPGHTVWRGSRIYYPSTSMFESIMEKYTFSVEYREALGVLMPPPYANQHVEKWPKLYAQIECLEERICKSRIACKLADHYLLVLKKPSALENSNQTQANKNI